MEMDSKLRLTLQTVPHSTFTGEMWGIGSFATLVGHLVRESYGYETFPN